MITSSQNINPHGQHLHFNHQNHIKWWDDVSKKNIQPLHFNNPNVTRHINTYAPAYQPTQIQSPPLYKTPLTSSSYQTPLYTIPVRNGLPAPNQPPMQRINQNYLTQMSGVNAMPGNAVRSGCGCGGAK